MAFLLRRTTTARIGRRISTMTGGSGSALVYSRKIMPIRTRRHARCADRDSFRSPDGGKGPFNLLPARHGDHHGLWIDPQIPTASSMRATAAACRFHRTAGNPGPRRTPADGAVLSRRRPTMIFPITSMVLSRTIRASPLQAGTDEGAIIARDLYGRRRGRMRVCHSLIHRFNLVYSNSENFIVRWTSAPPRAGSFPCGRSTRRGARRPISNTASMTSPLMMSPHNPDTALYGMEASIARRMTATAGTAISGDLTRVDK